jgi:U3 small nucleolar RNA-associated protein 7
MDKLVKLWDTRSFKEPLTQYKTKSIVHNIALSQRNVMALAIGDKCEIFRTVSTGNVQSIDSYLKHSESSPISSLQYVPYEDILGIGTKNGFSSILVPGCGEANFDALEQNPFRTKQQRREHEVKALLEKIPADLITLDASQIVKVDIEHLEEKLDKKPEVQVSYHLVSIFNSF